jgi:hypothetical protein
MKAKAFAAIFAALTLCWPAVGFSDNTQVGNPLIGSWKCELTRPQSQADRPVFINVSPGGLGFIVPGSDVTALSPFGQRSGVPFEWRVVDKNQRQIAYSLIFDGLLYDESGLVAGRFPGRILADLTLNDSGDELDDEFHGAFRFYVTKFIYETRSGDPEVGAAIVGEEVIAADPTGQGGSVIDCIRFGADPVYQDLEEGRSEPSVPLLDIIGY